MSSKRWIVDRRKAFGRAVTAFERGAPIWILTHNDADGLAAAALLARAFLRIAVLAQVRILGRGENPWSTAIGGELASRKSAG